MLQRSRREEVEVMKPVAWEELQSVWCENQKIPRIHSRNQWPLVLILNVEPLMLQILLNGLECSLNLCVFSLSVENPPIWDHSIIFMLYFSFCHGNEIHNIAIILFFRKWMIISTFSVLCQSQYYNEVELYHYVLWHLTPHLFSQHFTLNLLSGFRSCERHPPCSLLTGRPKTRGEAHPVGCDPDSLKHILTVMSCRIWNRR